MNIDLSNGNWQVPHAQTNLAAGATIVDISHLESRRAKQKKPRKPNEQDFSLSETATKVLRDYISSDTIGALNELRKNEHKYIRKVEPSRSQQI